LLKDVYNSREKDIIMKQKLKKENEWFRQYEKQLIETAIA
jgi:hypothetical protein